MTRDEKRGGGAKRAPVNRYGGVAPSRIDRRWRRGIVVHIRE